MSEARLTIGKAVSVTGVGLHTGAHVTLTLAPAAAGTGIVFRRIDLPTKPDIPARVDSVSSTDRRVCLGRGEHTVATVEHVLASVVGAGIDDIVVEVDGPEVPIGDGSSRLFHEALTRAGVTEVAGAPTILRVSAPFTVTEGTAHYVVAPGNGLRLTVSIEWDHPLIGKQSGHYSVQPKVFTDELAGARTFGFENEAGVLREKGLIKGASLENLVVLTEVGLAGGELRWPDEFVRHKAVDLLGDLALLSGRVHADIVAFRPSHKGNVALVRMIERAGLGTAPPAMDIQDILNVLPHRYPFLLVDRILEVEPGKRIVGLKNVTMNEPFFQGHFPEHPVMPGVLIVEAMAQTGGMLLLDQVDDPEGKIVYFMSIDGVKFRKPVVPGDQLRFELEMLKFRGKTCRMRGVAYVSGQPVAEAEMMAAIVDR
jgi:UDP-3-O-[3-hydroxymyristoyl] N-acetylglucosamine deacetylase/3-hydroxyacyl-[acyl-carrier-protein] dehydratase